MTIIETPQPLSIDSFSYSWLIDSKPSLDSISDSFRAALDSSDETSFIEMDPNMPPSKRFKKLAKNFDFDFNVETLKTESPVSSSLSACVFSEGQKRRAFSADACKLRCSSLRRCRSLLSRKTFDKYLYFMYPLLEKIRWCSRSKSKRNRAVDKRVWAVKNSCRSYSPPRSSVGSCASNWRKSFDSESSIHEAVLHCKKSIGM